MNILRNVAIRLAVLFLFAPGLFAVTWTTIDFPGASLTEVHGINTAGDMVGSYMSGNGSGPVLGFLDVSGVFTTINYPGSTFTKAYAINDNDDIVGIYIDTSNVTHGFLLQGQTFTSLDPPGSLSTFAQGINNAGRIVGFYEDGTQNGKIRGFKFSGGTYTPVDMAGSAITEVLGINNNGDLAGLVTTGTSNVPSGFVLSGSVVRHLKFHSLATQATAINDQKRVAGFASNSQRTLGFIYFQGKYVVLNVPSAPQSSAVWAFGINNGGSVVGAYLDDTAVEHGFLRTIN